MNKGKYRQIILDTLKEHPVHPNVYELYQLIKKNHPKVGMATIYRNLDDMAARGEVLRFNTGSQYDRYDGTVKEHYHMVCAECTDIIDVPSHVVNSLDKKTEELTGMKITGHNLSFKGICTKCMKKA